jgi:glycosyltransferase involved in cell wall biosynthesis
MFSVLVTTYKNPLQLEKCLQALKDQTLDPSEFEVIIIDNAPTNDTEILCSKFENYKYTIETKPGSYSARNKGLKESKGSVIAFTDSDCTPHKNWLMNAKEKIKGSCIDLLAGRINIVVKNEKNLYELFDKKNGFKQFTYFSNGHYGATANLFASKEVFKKHGVFNDLLFSCGDREFCQRVVKEGGLLAYCNNIVVNHPARSTFKELFYKRIRIAGGKSLLKNPETGYEDHFSITLIMKMKMNILKRILKFTSKYCYKLYQKEIITRRRRE